MLSKLRRYRPSHATVVAYLALFVALGGSSYAALKVTSRNVPKDALTGADIKNLTGRDVRNNSLTGADVRNIGTNDVTDSSLLPQDFAPGQLPTGPQGPQGPQGERGSQGEPGPFPDGNLPRGHTIRGGFALFDRASGDGDANLDAISFVYRLASIPTPHVIRRFATPPPECPGTAEMPEALPGHLCVYVDTETAVQADVGGLLADNLTTTSDGDRHGKVIQVRADCPPAGTGDDAPTGCDFATKGTWAVTSP